MFSLKSPAFVSCCLLEFYTKNPLPEGRGASFVSQGYNKNLVIGSPYTPCALFYHINNTYIYWEEIGGPCQTRTDDLSIMSRML